eukprot:GILI01019284.1.p1 GENE.GILI01019284.1~~GILI01019284.1.p1  ORF type:complete len:364 (+),score=62.07 GILI01019284.1:679-1770(+)
MASGVNAEDRHDLTMVDIVEGEAVSHATYSTAGAQRLIDAQRREAQLLSELEELRRARKGAGYAFLDGQREAHRSPSAASTLSRAYSVASSAITSVSATKSAAPTTASSAAWSTTFSAVQERSKQLQSLLDDSAALIGEVGKRRMEARARSEDLRAELRTELENRGPSSERLFRERSLDQLKATTAWAPPSVDSSSSPPNALNDLYRYQQQPPAAAPHHHNNSKDNEDMRRQLVRAMFLGPSQPTNERMQSNSRATSSSAHHFGSVVQHATAPPFPSSHRPFAIELLRRFAAADDRSSGSVSLHTCLTILNASTGVGATPIVTAGDVMNALTGRESTASNAAAEYPTETMVPYASLLSRIMGE